MKTVDRINGPYIHSLANKGGLAGRAYFNITYTDGTQTSILRSRFLMQQHLGRKLQPHEHVDHINGDSTDDRLENLQVLSIEEHARKTNKEHKEIEYIEFTCPVCSTSTKKQARYVRANRKQGKAGPFCSRSCAGKWKTKQ